MENETLDARFETTQTNVARATPEETTTARDLYANDDVSIDDDAPVSRTDTGLWVQAWVYIDQAGDIERAQRLKGTKWKL